MIYVLLAIMTVAFSWQSLCARLYSGSYAGPDTRDSGNVYSMVYGCVIALATFAVNGFAFSARLETVLLGLANAVVLTIYTTSIVKGSLKGPYSFLTLCQLSGAILVPMIASTLFMGERLTLLQILGVAVMLASFAVMNLKKGAAKVRPPKEFYFWCAALFLSNGLYGQLMNRQQYITQGAERAEMIICTYSFMALIVLAQFLILKPKRFLPSFRMGRRSLLFALGACACSTCATNIMVYLLTAMGSATVLYTINNGSVLMLGGLYSVLIFREKPTRSLWIGLLLAATGIVLLSL